jgi:hypothetical protein
VYALVSPVREVATCINGVRFKIKGNNLLLQIWMNVKVHENMSEFRQYMKESLQIYDDRVFTLLYFPKSQIDSTK